MARLGDVADAMAARVRSLFYPAGATLYREGEAAHEIFFVRGGEVALRKDGEEPWVLGERTVVGVLDVMQDRARDRTAVAVTDTEVLVVSAEDWFDVFEDSFETTRHAVTGVAQSLHELGLKLPPTGGFPPPVPDDTDARPIRALDQVERIITLRSAPLLARSNVQPLAGLAALVEERRLAAGETLFRLGGPSDSFFLVVRGLVDVAREDPLVRAGFGPGQVVGGYGAIALSQHPWSAVARIPSQVFRVGLEEYYDLMEDHFELARSVLAEMAGAREHVMRRIAEREQLAARSDRGDPVVPTAG